MAVALAISAVLLFAIGLSACAAMGTRPNGEWLDRLERSPRYDKGKMTNGVPTKVMRGNQMNTVWKFLFDKAQREPTMPPPIERRKQSSFANTAGLRITWFGHASALVEIDGYRVLTDPIFSERASPVGWAGPTRFFDSPVTAADLPDLDVVVISHDHYDHLDYKTILALKDRTKLFAVPLGVGAHLDGWGIPKEKIIELDWWGETTREGLRLVATPARHFSGRGLFDRNTTLWASWAIIGPKHRVYFSGDTGMFSGFSDIGERLGPFDASLMHIGAYGEAWPEIHMDPSEAVTAHQMIRGGLFIPIHWGTFNLALHSWTEPVERLLVAAGTAGVEVTLPKPGASVQLRERPLLSPWWEPRALAHATTDTAESAPQ